MNTVYTLHEYCTYYDSVSDPSMYCMRPNTIVSKFHLNFKGLQVPTNESIEHYWM